MVSGGSNGILSSSADSISGSEFTAGAGPTSMTSPENESVFLVYLCVLFTTFLCVQITQFLCSFIFTLQEFSKELISLIDAMGRVYAYEQQRINSLGWLARALIMLRQRIFNSILRCCGFKKSAHPGSNMQERQGLRRRICGYFARASLLHTKVYHIFPAAFIVPTHRQVPPQFPKIQPHAPNTVQTPARSNLSFFGGLGQRLWQLGKRMKESDIKYAVKAGMATALLASPAFFNTTRGIFVGLWGDWALISVCGSPRIVPDRIY